ncbi:MAG: DnaD domain protein [Negativibacillus sp.]
MNYQIDYRAFSGIFAVPTQVKSLLNTCSGTSLKVLLLILSSPDEPISASRLAGTLGFPPSDVEEALDYWCKNGILSAKGQFPAEEAEQLSLSSLKPKVRRASARKNLTVQEMEQLYNSDPNISALLDEAQSQLGRLLYSPEKETLCSYYSYYHLSAEALLLILMYCIQNEHGSFRSFERIANEMLENEIDTYEKAEKFINSYAARKENEGLVRSAFGIYDRALSSKEKDYINTWFETYHFDISIIKLAYERTIDNIGKTSFPYTNRILSDWYSKGIKTAKDASLETLSQKKNNSYQSKNGSMASSFDMEEIQKILDKGEKTPF